MIFEKREVFGIRELDETGNDGVFPLIPLAFYAEKAVFLWSEAAAERQLFFPKIAVNARKH